MGWRFSGIDMKTRWLVKSKREVIQGQVSVVALKAGNEAAGGTGERGRGSSDITGEGGKKTLDYLGKQGSMAKGKSTEERQNWCCGRAGSSVDT